MVYRVLSGSGVGLQRLRHFVLSRGTLKAGWATRNGRRLLRDRDWRGAPSSRRQPRLHRCLQQHSRGLLWNRLSPAGLRERHHCNDLCVGLFLLFVLFYLFIFCLFYLLFLHTALVMHYFQYSIKHSIFFLFLFLHTASWIGCAFFFYTMYST